MGQELMSIDQNGLKPMSLEQMKEQASIVISSGILPPDSATPEQVIAKALIGREYGMEMMESQREIYSFKGKGGGTIVMVKAEKLLQMTMERIPGFRYDVIEDTDEVVCVKYYRLLNGHAMERIIRTSTKDSDVIPLLSKDNWKYRNLMLWYTNMRKMVRTFCPDAKKYTEPKYSTMEEAQGAIDVEYSHQTSSGESVPYNPETGEITCTHRISSEDSIEVTPESDSAPPDLESQIDAAREASGVKSAIKQTPEPTESPLDIAERLAARSAAPPSDGQQAMFSGDKCTACDKEITKKVSDFSIGRHGTPLCYECQQQRTPRKDHA